VKKRWTVSRGKKFCQRDGRWKHAAGCRLSDMRKNRTPYTASTTNLWEIPRSHRRANIRVWPARCTEKRADGGGQNRRRTASSSSSVQRSRTLPGILSVTRSPCPTSPKATVVPIGGVRRSIRWKGVISPGRSGLRQSTAGRAEVLRSKNQTIDEIEPLCARWHSLEREIPFRRRPAAARAPRCEQRMSSERVLATGERGRWRLGYGRARTISNRIESPGLSPSRPERSESTSRTRATQGRGHDQLGIGFGVQSLRPRLERRQRSRRGEAERLD